MAKSQRASSRKRNNAVLRSKLFGPASDARTERLSAKLQEMASKPKPEQEKAMDVDQQEDTAPEQPVSAEVIDEGRQILQISGSIMLTCRIEMDVDAQITKGKSTKKRSATSKNPSRVSKHRVMKPKKARNNVIFPDLQDRKQRQKERRSQGKR